jgi:hypothetical protein
MSIGIGQNADRVAVFQLQLAFEAGDAPGVCGKLARP